MACNVHGVQGVASSNPAAPTKKQKGFRFAGSPFPFRVPPRQRRLLRHYAATGVDVASNALLFGALAANKLLLVNAWIELHREELIASCHAGRLTGEFMKVAPLR